MNEATVEATGETVSEAKWRALRELELLVPSLDKEAVQFQVLSEGERGLLGVGYTPARVLATAPAGQVRDEPVPEDGSEAARRLRDVLTHITAGIGVRCRIEIEETDETLIATCYGDDLGILIGRHGQTIDAVQVLANAIAGGSGDERREVVVDASGYRDRRRRTLESLALRSAEEAVRTGERVELEPMSAPERKIVHTSLEHHEGVTTVSEGEGPNRRVVVEPVS
jgi:spoIIIJ-associated protein